MLLNKPYFLQRRFLITAVLVFILPLAGCFSFKDLFVKTKDNLFGETVSLEGTPDVEDAVFNVVVNAEETGDTDSVKTDDGETVLSTRPEEWYPYYNPHYIASATDGGEISTRSEISDENNEEGPKEEETGLSIYEIIREKFALRKARNAETEENQAEAASETAISGSDNVSEQEEVVLAAITEREESPSSTNNGLYAETQRDTNTIETGNTDGGEISKGDGVNVDSKEVSLDRTTLSVGRIKQPFDVFPEYRITPGDLLDVLYQMRTWTRKDQFKIAVDQTISVKFVHAPELNEEQIIRPDGKITLPYLGDIVPVGMTVSEFTDMLKSSYRNILQSPEIYVTVPEFRRTIKELKTDLHTAPRGLSRLVTVRPDGYATFAMIGHVRVAGRTIPEVNDEINKMYDEMIPGLHCDLFLEKQAGTVVYVVGEVKLPGAFNINKPTTVVEAIALAGSYLQGAKLESIIVARKYEGKVVCTRINLKKVLSLQKGSKFMYLQPDDIIYVPKTYIKRVGELMRDVADIFLFRGWGSSLSFSWELRNSDTTNRGGTTTRIDGAAFP